MFSNIFPHMQDWHSESGSDFVAEDFFFFFFFGHMQSVSHRAPRAVSALPSRRTGSPGGSASFSLRVLLFNSLRKENFNVVSVFVFPSCPLFRESHR